MEKGKGLARRWAIEFADSSSSSPSDIPDPIGFSRSSSDPDDANASRQKKDAEAAWKTQSWLWLRHYLLLEENDGLAAFMLRIELKSLGSGSSPIQKLVNDGVHDVDGWKHSSFIQYRYYLLSPLATNKCSSRSWKRTSIHVDTCFTSPPTFRVAMSMLFVCLAVFEPYKDSRVDTLAPKLLFIALNLAALALGVWKLNSLGLLPTHPSDWVSSLPPPPLMILLSLYSRKSNTLVGGFPCTDVCSSALLMLVLMGPWNSLG
ncbi:hypothetical protein ZIOFF_049717 [Zingiber officinale]|uniref:ER membrane protein complex subunit 4 n=1 Tax=Zingiber officinale TaxID=94328 RepID=A0A8J5FJ88_ZINOF|nr:hypothetical protein ZIOFF_049717 [Zingiber officinale]